MGRLAVVLICCFAATSFADDEVEMEGDTPPAGPITKDPKVAKKWLGAAQQLVQKGDAATRAKKPDEAKVNYENAMTAYDKAAEAGDVNAQFEAGTFAERIGRLDRAAAYFRAYVKVQGARADLVKRAQARFDDLTTKTGLVTIFAKPDGATISVNGNEIGKAPLAEPLIMMPDTYTFTIAAEGHKPKDIEFKVEPGSESERTVELEPGATIIIEKPKKPDQPEQPIEQPLPESPTAPSKLPLYIGLGATGGLVLVATITGLTAMSKHTTFEDENASPSSREDAKSSGKTFAVVTDICLVGALAAGGFTAYWYFAKYKPAQRKMSNERTAKTQVVPWVKPDAGGLVLAGSF